MRTISPLAGVLLALSLLGTWSASAQPVGASDELRVIYPQPETTDDPRARYPLAVLELALSASGLPYRLVPSPLPMQQSRALLLLREGKRMDVVWSAPSTERAEQLRIVPIPIDRGLLGWRVLLIRKGDASRFAAIRNAEQLRSLRGVQGHDWPDLAVLRDNGLDVYGSPSFSGLFAMLARGRADYFPRAVSEVQIDLRMHPKLDLEIEPALLLYYPFGMYFLVNKDNKPLADALEQGLRRSLDDHALQALFEHTYADMLAELAIDQRRVLRLDNRELPPELRAQHPGYWIPDSRTPP